MSYRGYYKVMLDYIEGNPCLLSRYVDNAPTNKQRRKLWKGFSKLLNDLEPNIQRSTNQWKRTWMRWKYSIQKKGKESGVKSLSSLEGRLYRLMERTAEEDDESIHESTENLNPVDSLDILDNEDVDSVGHQGINGAASNNTSDVESENMPLGKQHSRRKDYLIAGGLEKIAEALMKRAEVEERNASALERMASALEAIPPVLRQHVELQADYDSSS